MASLTNLITKAKTFEPNDVQYKPPVTNKRGGKSVQLTLYGQPIVLQIPLMLTWGVNERVDEQSGRVTYDMSLQFDPTKSPAQREFLGRLKRFEEKVKTDACNTKEWFGRKNSREVIDALMYPVLKYPKLKDGSGEPDYDRNPTLKIKLPFWEGRFNVELYSMDRKPMYLPPKDNSQDLNEGRTPSSCIPKASYVNGLIQCQGMWFAGGKCGVTWKLVQACVRPPQRLVGMGTCHVLEDSDDDEVVESLNSKDAEQEEEEEEDEQSKPSFDFEEEDEEDEEEEEEVVQPTPVKKKKRVVKRKKKVVKSDA